MSGVRRPDPPAAKFREAVRELGTVAAAGRVFGMTVKASSRYAIRLGISTKMRTSEAGRIRCLGPCGAMFSSPDRVRVRTCGCSARSFFGTIHSVR